MQVAQERGSNTREDALQAMRAQLHAFIARRVESPEVADDLTQDVLLRILTRSHEDVEVPTAWFYRVARNAIIDHYRARESRARLAIDSLPRADPTENPFAEDPEQAQRELAGCLRPLLDQLPEPYRSAVTAIDLNGHTHAEAAHAIGLSVSGMKSRVQRGRVQLRELLTDCCSVFTNATGGISDYEPASGCRAGSTGDASRRCISACA
jgi:RNA polymerase sigma-70 factor (ECF subfamily)